MRNCTYIVPENKFGIFACHTENGIPLDDEFIHSVIDGPITSAEPKTLEELAKPIKVDKL